MKQKLSFLGIAFAVFFAGKTIAGEPTKSILFNSTVASAGASDATKSVIKLNLFALGLTNFSLQYEYAFHKDMSGALGISFMPSRGLPGPLSSDSLTKGITLSGWSCYS